jgi:hypothetical protein
VVPRRADRRDEPAPSAERGRRAGERARHLVLDDRRAGSTSSSSGC